MRIEDVNTFWTDKAVYNNAERLFYEGIKFSIPTRSKVSWFHHKPWREKEWRRERGEYGVVGRTILNLYSQMSLKLWF